MSTSSVLACPVCLSPSAFEQTCKEADLYRCTECKHCFSDPSTVRQPETYGPEYYEKNWFQNANTELFDFVASVICQRYRGAAVLDAGCGNGAFLRYLHRKHPSLSLTGIDLAPNQPEDGINFLQHDVLETDFPKKFDAVVTLAVIEHLADVRSFMSRLGAMCVTGGTLIVMTLNDMSILYMLARTFKRLGFGMPADQLYSSHHLNHFNLGSLKRLVEGCGFKVEETRLHDIPLGAVDIVASRSALQAAVLRAGVWGIFLLQRLTGRTYLQTLVCTKT